MTTTSITGLRWGADAGLASWGWGWTQTDAASGEVVTRSYCTNRHGRGQYVSSEGFRQVRGTAQGMTLPTPTNEILDDADAMRKLTKSVHGMIRRSALKDLQ